MRVFSHYCANPGLIYCNLMTRIFQYLGKILELGIIFESDFIDNLVRYTNLDWTRLKNKKKLISGYVFFLSREPISHPPKQ